jgi:hypothetical protein
MNIQDIINAFGHSSTSAQIDDLLEAFGCKTRPKRDESHVTVKSPGKDVVFEFSSVGTYKEDVPEGPQSDGWYILRSVYVEPKYKGEMPFGLSWTMDGDAVTKTLGTPVKTKSIIQTYFHQGIIVNVRFANDKKQKIEFIRFSIKDKYDSEHFGI